MKSYKTEIFNHISGCEEYKTNLLQFDPDPGPKNKKTFLLEHFNILQNNLLRYTDRSIIEAHCIRMLLPEINKQNDHRVVVFI